MIRFKLLGALVFLSMSSLALPPAFGGQDRQIAAPPCMTDHGPSDCGEPMWIYGAPEQHAQKRHSGFEINQSGGGAVAELVGIRVGVVSGVMNLESSGVEAPDWRPRHEQVYHDA